MSVTCGNVEPPRGIEPRPTHYECVGPDGAHAVPPAETQPCDALSAAIPAAKPTSNRLQAEINTDITPEQVAALYQRLARYKRRRQAAERGEKWWLVR